MKNEKHWIKDKNHNYSNYGYTKLGLNEFPQIFYFQLAVKIYSLYFTHLKVPFSSQEKQSFWDFKGIFWGYKLSNPFWSHLPNSPWLSRVSGLGSFFTSCRPCWLSFPHILKIACVTSTHWPHQHFELLSFLVYPNNAQFYFVTSGSVIKPKVCRPVPTGLWAVYTPECTSRFCTLKANFKKSIIVVLGVLK